MVDCHCWYCCFWLGGGCLHKWCVIAAVINTYYYYYYNPLLSYLSVIAYVHVHTHIHMYCSLFIICKCHQPPKTRKLWGYKRITGWACVSIALHLVAYSQRVNVTMKRRFKCVGKIYRVAFLSFLYPTLHNGTGYYEFMFEPLIVTPRWKRDKPHV